MCFRRSQGRCLVGEPQPWTSQHQQMAPSCERSRCEHASHVSVSSRHVRFRPPIGPSRGLLLSWNRRWSTRRTQRTAPLHNLAWAQFPQSPAASRICGPAAPCLEAPGCVVLHRMQVRYWWCIWLILREAHPAQLPPPLPSVQQIIQQEQCRDLRQASDMSGIVIARSSSGCSILFPQHGSSQRSRTVSLERATRRSIGASAK